jgi:hypothetical protein
MDGDKLSSLYREHCIDASYQVSIHLAKWFQLDGKIKISAYQRQKWPVAAIFVNGLGRNEQSL